MSTNNENGPQFDKDFEAYENQVRKYEAKGRYGGFGFGPSNAYDYLPENKNNDGQNENDTLKEFQIGRLALGDDDNQEQ